MSVSGYCWMGDERDGWDDQDYDEMNARRGAFDMAPGQ